MTENPYRLLSEIEEETVKKSGVDRNIVDEILRLNETRKELKRKRQEEVKQFLSKIDLDIQVKEIQVQTEKEKEDEVRRLKELEQQKNKEELEGASKVPVEIDNISKELGKDLPVQIDEKEIDEQFGEEIQLPPQYSEFEEGPPPEYQDYLRKNAKLRGSFKRHKVIKKELEKAIIQNLVRDMKDKFSILDQDSLNIINSSSILTKESKNAINGYNDRLMAIKEYIDMRKQVSQGIYLDANNLARLELLGQLGFISDNEVKQTKQLDSTNKLHKGAKATSKEEPKKKKKKKTQSKK